MRPNKNNIVNWTQYITPAMEDLAEKQNWGRQPQNEGPLRYNWSTPFQHLAEQPARVLRRVEPPADVAGSRHDVADHQPGPDDRTIRARRCASPAG